MDISKILLNGKSIKYAYIGNSLMWAKPWLAVDFFSKDYGAWFDLNDITTLFQDTSGTIPVIASGDPIALVLDKSQNLELGPEIREHDNFIASDLSHITSDNNNLLEIIDNKLRITRVNEGYLTGAIRISNITPNKWYRLEIVGEDIGREWPPIHTTSVPFYVYYKENSEFGIYYFKATQNYVNIEIGTLSINDDSIIEISKLSLKEFKGNHASQRISSSRPIYKKIGDKKGFEIDEIDDMLEISLPQNINGNISIASNAGISTKPINIPANTSYNLLSQYASSKFTSEIIIRNTPYTDLEKYAVETHLLRN